MTTVLVFDIETIPDIAGLRRLEDYPQSMSDAEVAAKAMADRLEKTGSEFLPLFLQKIVAISCVIRRTTKEGLPQIKVGTLGTPQEIFSEGLFYTTPIAKALRRIHPTIVSLTAAQALLARKIYQP